MTVTVPRWGAVLLIALVGMLGGLAIGQVTRANSSGPSATASYTAPFERSLKEIARDLHSMKRALGDPGYIGDSVVETLEKIRGNTYATCQNTGGSAYCHNGL